MIGGENMIKKKYIFYIIIIVTIISIIMSSTFLFSNKELEMRINNVNVQEISSDQIKEDLDVLVEAIKNTGTDYIVDQRVFNFDIEDFKNKLYKKNKGEYTVRDLYEVSKDVLPNKNRHTRLMEPKEILTNKTSLYSGKLESRKMRYDTITIKKNESLNKMLNKSADISNYKNDFFTSSLSNSANGIPTMKILEEGKTAYIKFPTFSINDSYKIPMSYFIEEIKDYDYLIIDILGNTGGKIEPWHDLMSELTSTDLYMEFYVGYRDTEIAKIVKDEALEGKATKGASGFENLEFEEVQSLPKTMDNINKEDLSKLKYYLKIKDKIEAKKKNSFNGKIYLLIDNKCFSSADLFAHYVKYTKFATIVGSPAAGDGTGGIGYLYFPFPNSGFIYQIQCAYGFNDDGSSNFESGTEPDIVAARNKELDYVLNEIKKTEVSPKK